MKDTSLPSQPKSADRLVRLPFSRVLNNLAKRAVISKLKRLEYGRITIVDNEVQHAFGTNGPAVSLTVSDPAFYADLALGGSIGAAEAYMSGFWSVDNLTTLIRIMVQNRGVLANMERGLALLMKPVQSFRYWRRRNTPAGSMRNIAAHYDLGNEFYGLWLDPTMTYSCNIFNREDATLEEAALVKYEKICNKMNLKPSDHVLEIGCGWGGFAVYAAKNYGCRITATTISRQQYEYALEQIRRENLTERIELLFKDYRDLEGRYDKLVSIEMIEAVGHHFLDTYFETCGRRLKPDGMMVLQSIVIEDHAYKSQLRNPDFIKRYIFPGSFIPSISAIVDSVAKASDMRLYGLEDITLHYARTLSTWRNNFFKNVDAIRTLGYPESFLRLWEYYFCYCEGGFLERYIGDVQMILLKPGWRP